MKNKSSNQDFLFCLEGNAFSPTSSGRFLRELGIALEKIKCPFFFMEQKGYLFKKILDSQTQFKSSTECEKLPQIRILSTPLFSLPKTKNTTLPWLITSFDPISPIKSEIQNIPKMKPVFVSSTTHRKRLIEFLVPEGNIHLLPRRVNQSFFPGKPAHSEFLPGSKSFSFLTVTSPLRRKGLDLILRAYLEEFSAKEPVRLVIKLTHLPKKKKQFSYEISDLGNRLGALNNLFPPVVIISDTVEDSKMGGLFSSCQVFVNANRSFHTGLTVLEALASGIPVIAPSKMFEIFGFNEEIGYIVQTRKAPATPGFLYSGSPATYVEESDIASLRKRMREAFAKPEETKRKGFLASQFSSRSQNWDEFANKIIELAKNR